MLIKLRLTFAVASLLLASCGSDRPETAEHFPKAERQIPEAAGTDYGAEAARDNRGEAEIVMEFAGVKPGMSVADIGAGEGYYTVRLADRVGKTGRVLAQDIDREALNRLARRIERERFDNVSIKLGKPDDPDLPENSFDAVFLVHMYHEVEEPYAFMWRLWPSVRAGGSVILVDANKDVQAHGIDPLVMSCELQATGYRLVEFKDAPDLEGYYAKFTKTGKRPSPDDIKPCKGGAERAGGA